MIKFITYKASGEITGSGSCPGAMLELQSRPNEGVLVMQSDASWADNYVSEAGDVISKGKQPSPHHIFAYAMKQWVDPRGLEDLKIAKWAEIKAARDSEEFGGFDWGGSRFDSNAISQNRIPVYVQLAVMSPAFTIEWTLADNSVRTLDAAGMAAVGAALGAHVAAQHAQARSLRLQIDAATSLAQLENINWSNV